MTKIIQLTQGFESIVSDQSVGILSAHKWHVSKKNSKRPVAQASIKDVLTGKYKSVLMHRFLLSAESHQHVDHINGDTLDNRIENLRIASPSENARNHKPRGETGLNGVKKNGRGCFCASISPSGLEISLGTFATKEDAASAYNQAATRVYGEFAKLNDVPVIPGLIDALIESKKAAVVRLMNEIEILSKGT